MSQEPSLKADSFADKNIANASIFLEQTSGGGMTNAVGFLVRPNDVRCDESGEHPHEKGFVGLYVTRQEIEAILARLNSDWQDHVRVCGAGSP